MRKFAAMLVLVFGLMVVAGSAAYAKPGGGHHGNHNGHHHKHNPK